MFLGIMMVLGWVIVALFIPYLAPFSPMQQNVQDRLTPPGERHFFGTDELGRDIFSRVLYGSRLTLPAALILILLGSLFGSVVGALAGYLGGFWDFILLRFTELFMAFPTIILAMAINAALGPDIKNTVLSLLIAWWPNYTRVMRASVLKTKRHEYVEAAYCLGVPRLVILTRTILPNSLSSTLVLTSLDVGNAILAFSGLSFLGFGPEPSSPEWGRMVAVGLNFFDQWWTWLFPSLAIVSVVTAFNFIGDQLQDLLDPRLRVEAMFRSNLRRQKKDT